MQKEKLIIEGMTCQHCVMGLKKDLTDAKVQFSNVGIGFAEVEVDENIHPEGKLKEIVSEAGYTLINIEKL